MKWTLPIAALSLALVADTALSESPVLPAAAAAAAATARPWELVDFLPSKGRQCYRRGRYRNFCEGPRRVAAPQGPAALLAERLKLGDKKAVSALLLDPPKPAWVTAAGEDPGHDSLLWPVEGGKFWRGFGKVKRGPKRRRLHRGVDIGAPDGTLIRAAKGGLVAYADNGVRGYGNLLVTVHPNGSVAFYAHCQSIFVFPGQQVSRGQIVAEVGHTGIARGPHLHFEYRINGRARDPVELFVGRPE